MGSLQRVVLTVAAFSLGALLIPFAPSHEVMREAERDSVTPPPVNRDAIKTDLADYSWPSENGKAVTSTFGEYRRTHFHGGIDISTNNRNGYRVLASRAGYVSRIRVNPNGYGKMLYVRHADGYITTYSHLLKFNAEIDARVRKEQLKLERFPVDIECSPVEFPVSKGDIIAYSGESGTGTPHLHFEIRDENLEPINPFLCPDLVVDDSIPPVPRRVAVRPLSPNSMVNGSTQAQILGLVALGRGEYKVSSPIRLSGQIGFAVQVKDRSDGTWFKHGVHSNELFIDGRLIHSAKLDRVPAETAHQINLYYDWDLLSRGRGRFEKLYADSPNDLPFYTPKGVPSGVVRTADFADGVHEFKIVSSDFNGQTATITGNVILNHAPNFEVEMDDDHFRLKFVDLKDIKKVMMYTKQSGIEQWTLKTITNPTVADGEVIIPISRKSYDIVKFVAENTWGTHSIPQILILNKPRNPGGSLSVHHDITDSYVLVMLRSNRIITAPPRLTVYEGNLRRDIPLTPVDEKTYTGVLYPVESYRGVRRLAAEAEVEGHMASANSEFELHPISPSTSGRLVFDNGNLDISYDSLSVYKTLFLQVEKNAYNGDVTYSLLPENTVLRKGLTVSVKSHTKREGQGLYFRGKGGWDLIANRPDSISGEFQGKITRWLGELSVIEDNHPPDIARLRISGTSGRRPALSFRLSDNLSGVEYNDVKLYIDGVFVIPEIDGEHRRVSYQVTDPLEKGPHLLTIHLRDRMGNRREVAHHFTVR